MIQTGFHITLVQTFARQILQSISALHSLKLTHTDLKPENILLINSHYDELKKRQSKNHRNTREYKKHRQSKTHREFRDQTHYRNNNYYNRNSDSHTTISRNRSFSRSRSFIRHLSKGKYQSQAKVFMIPRHDEIKVIDFGGATFDYEHHTSIINTRQYRAPEVILQCCRWDQKSDIWSIACIILELYSGKLYFDTHNNYEHLALIQKQFGSFPVQMIKKSPRKIQEYFLYNSHFDCSKTLGVYLDWPSKSTTHGNIKKVIEMKTYKQIIFQEHIELINLLNRMFEVDPEKRISCEEALQHEFFSVKYY